MTNKKSLTHISQRCKKTLRLFSEGLLTCRKLDGPIELEAGSRKVRSYKVICRMLEKL